MSSAASGRDDALIVVIDGPAGAGKSTVARRVAAHFGVQYLDTGAIYRTVALAADRADVGWDDGVKLAGIARALKLEFVGAPQRVMLDGEDVSEAIRTPHVSEGASRVSAHPQVRGALLDLQRALGARGCAAEGRDMGTVVFPDTPHKFFLTASLEARASRRHADLVAVDPGGAPSLVDVQHAVEKRDTRDSSRAAAPLRQAEDAVLIDSTQLEPDAVVSRIVELVNERLPAG